MTSQSSLPLDWQSPEIVNPIATAEHAREYLKNLKKILPSYLTGRDFDVCSLIKHYTEQVDKILITLYAQTIHNPDIALFAVGGYGRAELFPASDIDLLILTPEILSDDESAQIHALVHSFWQLGLEISHSVRSKKQLLQDALTDGDMLTSLLEKRQLAGTRVMFDPSAPPIITKTAYIALKLAEQNARDNKQEHTGLLEPNIKTDSGGLRDLQMIRWLTLYCYHQAPEKALVEKNILTLEEIENLEESRNALWRIRFALHLQNRRGKKDILKFEQQKLLAQLFSYRDQTHYLAIEQFMHHYYRHSMSIRRINRRTVALIEADQHPPQPLLPVSPDFALKNNKLTLLDHRKLKKTPALLWQIFLFLQDNPDINGIHPDLVRELRQQREKVISAEFRRDSDIRRLFLKILARAGNVFPQVRRMHRYGLLYRYITAFWHIAGRMQYDLFHQYTVDQHTLQVLRYLDSFTVENKNYPRAAELMAELKHPETLYLAALFHDIGKGYNGDHSEIGAEIVNLFARENDAIDDKQREMLIFLVRQHLTFSTTAQKKDLFDSAVISEFAALFPDREHLDQLYLLTMADISATNKTLWNSWRANLLQQLYHQTRHILEHSEASLIRQQQAEKQTAKRLLLNNAPQTVEQLWNKLPEAFFHGESAEVIARKSAILLTSGGKHKVSLLQTRPLRLLISSPNPADILFARLTHFLERYDANIVEARLYTTSDRKQNLQQYTLSGDIPPEKDFLLALESYTAEIKAPPPPKARLAPVKLQHFETTTEVISRQDDLRGQTILELICKDRHGLLSLLSRIFLKFHIHIKHAKITTLGEKAEDSFYLTDAQQNPITDERLKMVEKEILTALS